MNTTFLLILLLAVGCPAVAVGAYCYIVWLSAKKHGLRFKSVLRDGLPRCSACGRAGDYLLTAQKVCGDCVWLDVEHQAVEVGQ